MGSCMKPEYAKVKRTSLYYGQYKYECVIPLDTLQRAQLARVLYKINRNYKAFNDIEQEIMDWAIANGIKQAINRKCVISSIRDGKQSFQECCVHSNSKENLEQAVTKIVHLLWGCEETKHQFAVTFSEVELLKVKAVTNDHVFGSPLPVIMKKPKHKFRVYLDYDYVVANRSHLAAIFETYGSQFFPCNALKKYLTNIEKHAPLLAFFDIDDENIIDMLCFIFSGCRDLLAHPIVAFSEVVSYQNTQECETPESETV